MQSDSFFIITEFGVGIAGFSGILVAISYRGGDIQPLDRFRVLNLLITALSAAFGGLVPHLLAGFGLHDGTLWRWSSIVVGTSFTVLLVDAQVRHGRLSPEECARLLPPLWYVVVSGVAILAALQLGNAARSRPLPGPVFASLVGLLAVSAFQFIRVLLVRSGDRPAA